MEKKKYHKQRTSWHLLAPGKGVVFLICKDSSKSIREKSNNPDAKLSDKKQAVFEEEQMALRHVKKCSTSLMKEMQMRLQEDSNFFFHLSNQQR